MKKYFLIALAAVLAISACKQAGEPKVMARYVPERYDDFVFENNLIAGRIYGEALEGDVPGGNIVSPGIDIWVKRPGALVADQRYRDELENGKTYHKDWGNGKDCYKVGRSLGGGASAAVKDGRLLYPATNYRGWECNSGNEKAVFTLSYPEWTADGITLSLSKTFTVTPDTYFVKVEDVYTFSGAPGDSIQVAAGIFLHPAQQTITAEKYGKDIYAIWEHASDQSIEPEDGMLGVAVYVPGSTETRLSDGGDHTLVLKTVRAGEKFEYYFGSCWSKGDVKTAEEWFDKVVEFSKNNE